MKTTAISFLAMMMSVLTLGQSNPQFKPAGAQASSSIYQYIRENISCPGLNTSCFRPGTEVIAFTVSSTGELKDFRVVSSVSPRTDVAVIATLKSTSGSWEPGSINGEPADMEHEVVMTFIPSNFDPVQKASMHLSKGNSLIYKNPRRALRHINEAFRLFPCSESVLVARSLCKTELGDVPGADEDRKRILALNSREGNQHRFSEPMQLLGNLSGPTE